MIKENHIIVHKTARYYTLGELNEKTKHVWIVLHGFRQNAKDFLAEFESLYNDSTFIISPEGLNRFYLNGHTGNVGATWMTKEDRLNEIKDYINYLNDLYENFEFEKFSAVITALGFSQGASTLTRWLNATQCRVDNAIVYAGEVAPEILPLQPHSSLRNTKNYFICGTKDEFFPPDMVSKMKAGYQELNFTELSFEGGHEVKLDVLNGLKL